MWRMGTCRFCMKEALEVLLHLSRKVVHGICNRLCAATGGECGIPTYSRFQMPTSSFLGYWYSFNLVGLQCCAHLEFWPLSTGAAAMWWVCSAGPLACLHLALLGDCNAVRGSSRGLLSASLHCHAKQLSLQHDGMTSACRGPSTTLRSAASLTSLRGPPSSTLCLP